MEEVSYRDRNTTTLISHPNWGAIWAGVFTFIAIWSIFGLLGMAIFASLGNPNAEHPLAGMSIGMAIWSIILTISAMYVAGRTTGHLAGIENSRDGVIHGVVMFGLSVTAVLAIAMLMGGPTVSASGTVSSVTAAGTAHTASWLEMFASAGWAGFVSLLLGWLAAMGGASAGAQRPSSAVQQQQVTHA
jgi:hypothetical protein